MWTIASSTSAVAGSGMHLYHVQSIPISTAPYSQKVVNSPSSPSDFDSVVLSPATDPPRPCPLDTWVPRHTPRDPRCRYGAQRRVEGCLMGGHFRMWAGGRRDSKKAQGPPSSEIESLRSNETRVTRYGIDTEDKRGELDRTRCEVRVSVYEGDEGDVVDEGGHRCEAAVWEASLFPPPSSPCQLPCHSSLSHGQSPLSPHSPITL